MKRENAITVIVHPGSFMLSYAAEIHPDIFAQRYEALKAEIGAAENLLVIDGQFSDTLRCAPLNDLLSSRIEELNARGNASGRIWGCDSGEPAPKDWARRHKWQGASQADVIEAHIRNFPDLYCFETWRFAGAWASRDGSEGCVNDVIDRVRDLMKEPAVHQGLSPQLILSPGSGFVTDDLLDPEALTSSIFGEEIDMTSPPVALPEPS